MWRIDRIFLFFSFKVLVNFGKFAGKEYKVSIIENEGNEESLNMEFVFSKNNNLSSKKMEFFNNILDANSPTPSKTNQWFDELKFSSTKLSLHTIKNVCNYITKKKRRKTASNRINSRWNLRNWRRRRREAKTNQNQEKKRNKIISTGYYACYFSLSLSNDKSLWHVLARTNSRSQRESRRTADLLFTVRNPLPLPVFDP